MSLSPHPGQPELLMPQAVLQRSAEHLAEKFDRIFSPQTVERVVFGPMRHCAAPRRSTPT